MGDDRNTVLFTGSLAKLKVISGTNLLNKRALRRTVN
jgi:hypothetical protein